MPGSLCLTTLTLCESTAEQEPEVSDTPKARPYYRSSGWQELSESRNLGALHADNLGSARLSLLPARGPARCVDRLGPLFHNVRRETLLDGIQRGALDAVVGREPHDVDVGHAPGREGCREPAVADARVHKGVVEGAVHLDLAPRALLDDLVYAGHVQLGDQLRAGRALHAVHRPQLGPVRLGGVVGVDDGGEVDKGPLGLVIGREGDVVGRVPVLGGDSDDEGWLGEQLVDDGDRVPPVVDGERPVLEHPPPEVVSRVRCGEEAQCR